MKYTVLFLTLLTMTSFVATQKAFDQVKNLLTHMREDIQKEQKEADVRNEKDKRECENRIKTATDKAASRLKDVDDLKAHIQYLQKEKSENEKDKKSREVRIVDNQNMLKKFKDDRCENNILFIKSLREHMEAVEIMKSLKEDINSYFQNKNSGKISTSFLERFSEFSHLLSEEKKQIFMQLSESVKALPSVENLTKDTNAASTQKQRTADEVGTEHVDNTVGELNKLEHVGHEETDEYNTTLHQKVNTMIDSLIAHLKESRDTLTKNEIKAAEDFAVFQTNVEKENVYLEEKIKELGKAIEDLESRINTANAQLKKREELLLQAKNELTTDKRICDEKDEYYAKETSRRTTELSTVGKATDVFENVLMKLSDRVRDRASNINSGQDAGKDLDGHVVNSVSNVQSQIGDNQNQRNALVF